MSIQATLTEESMVNVSADAAWQLVGPGRTYTLKVWPNGQAYHWLGPKSRRLYWA